MENVLKIEKKGATWCATVNRPESLNALNADVLQSFMLLCDDIKRSSEVRVLVVTGEGPKSFVAGADIASMNQLGPRAIADYIELGQRVMRSLENLSIPVIAAVNGFALGGGMELALACDIIVASDSAKFGQPEVNLGIIPGFGGTQRIIQRAGVGAAKRLVFTGDIIGAEEALRMGLVDKIVPQAELISVAHSIADTIASKGPLAVAGAKRVINSSEDNRLAAGLRVEVEEFLRLFASRDREEGMTAFLQKRKAEFTGR